MLQAVIFVVFPFCMVYAAVSDLMSMQIANRVSLLLIVTFAIVAPLAGMDWATYGTHFAAAALVLAVTFGLFSIGAMGGGDAKLMTGVAIWAGLSLPLLQFLVISAVFGGLLTVFVLAYRRSPLSVYLGNIDFLFRIGDKDRGVPYAIALGAAGLMTFPAMPLAVWALTGSF